MKRWLGIIALAVGIALPGVALAYSVQTGNVVTVPKGETKTGTFYAAGSAVTIDGDINGDLICAGSNVTVNGAVHGDVICAGQTVSVNGPVDGSVRVAGQSVNINGSVGRNVTTAGQSVNLASAAKVNGDFGAWGQTVTVSGPVLSDVYGAMDTLVLGSTVGGVDVRVNNMSLTSGAQVQGNLTYTSANTFGVNQSQVGGSVTRHEAPKKQAAAQTKVNFAHSWFWMLFYWLVAALVVGIVLVLLVPRLMERVTRTMRERPGATVGWGFLVTVLWPIVFVILLLTVIGIPLALLVGTLWLLLLLTSGVVAGIAFGQWLLGRFNWKADSLLWATIIGIPIAVIIFNVPIIGWLLAFVAAWWAMGGWSLSAGRLRA